MYKTTSSRNLSGGYGEGGSSHHYKPRQPKMLFTTIFTSLAIAAAPAWAIPPPIFGFPDSDNHTELGVTYTFNGNQTTVQEGMLFGSNSEFQSDRKPHPSNYYAQENQN